MPRSNRRINEDRAALARCKKIIHRALDSFTGNRDAVSIVQRIQWHYSKDIEADRPLCRLLQGKGLEPIVRDVLREWGIGVSSEDEPPQLDLFPEAERDVVRQIGRARIWVPSLHEHSQYHSEALDPDQLDESGNYYIAHANRERRVGEAIKQLARIRRGGGDLSLVA